MRVSERKLVNLITLTEQTKCDNNIQEIKTDFRLRANNTRFNET